MYQSESTLYICLNVKELLCQNNREKWRVSDSNWTRTHSSIVRKRTLNHLAKLAKWLSFVVSTYLYPPFNCVCLSCHGGASKWIHTMYLFQCGGTPCSKQPRSLNFKCVQLVFWALICMVHLTVCSCHVTYAFQSESIHYFFLNVKKLLPQKKREFWRVSDWTGLKPTTT